MSSLWRGRDHLIYVRGSGYLIPISEEYRRYRFEDIQAISISRKSRLGMSVLYTLGMLSFAGPLVLVLALSGESRFSMTAAILVSMLALGTLLFASLLLRHLILGPTCVCDLQTSLSRDRILSLTRFHAARQCVDLIVEDIRSAQEPLNQAPATEVVELRESERRREESFSIPPVVVPNFVGVIVLGIGALATLHLESVGLTIFMLFALLVVSFLLTFSQILSVRKPTPDSIKTLLWITKGLLFVFVGTATVYLLISAARNPKYTLDFMGPIEALTGVANGGGMGFYLIFVGLSLGFFTCGIVGLTSVLRWKTINQERSEALEDQQVSSKE
ncbi:MAG: hypothetical protein AAF357_12570 [Verrucomicrobiota bacterium]